MTAPTYNIPTEPVFSTISLPTPITIDVPALPTNDLSTTTLDIDNVNSKLEAWSYTRYGSLIQDVIDGKLEDLLAWTQDEDILNIKLSLLKDDILYKAETASREPLKATAARGFPFMPGKMKRAIYDIESASRKLLADEVIKIFGEQNNISQENLSVALKLGAEKEAALFSHHNTVQMANLDAVITIANNCYVVFAENVKTYNSELAAWSIELKNHQEGRRAQLLNLDNHVAQMEAIVESEKKGIRNAEIFEATINLNDVLNKISVLETKIIEIDAKIIKNDLLIYQNQLKEYIAGIEVIKNTYRQFRVDVEEKIVDKDRYLKELSVLSDQLSLQTKTLISEQTQSKLELEQAKTLVEKERTLLTEAGEIISLNRLQNQSINQIYQNSLESKGITDQNTVDASIVAFEEYLNLLESTTKEILGQVGEDSSLTARLTRYSANYRRAWQHPNFIAKATVESARLQAAADVKNKLVHNYHDSTS